MMVDSGNKTIVVCQTKYGTTQRYARWIAEEVHADLFARSEITFRDLLKYDTIVYGGAVYAVGILGITLITKNFDKLRGKRMIVFSVGASPAHPEAVNAVQKHNFTDEMKRQVHFFHLRGSFDYGRLKLFDKVLMFLLRKKLERKKPEERTDDEQGMLASYQCPADWTNKDAIIPIVECIHNRGVSR